MSSAVEAVWAAWIKHVAQCTNQCKTVGRDCARAAELRLELRAARTAELPPSSTADAPQRWAVKDPGSHKPRPS
ncbi:hypothetical protein ACIHCQ_40025 [Streptomyces sp. NPDC052236]|uniref:hypothetical protein n=1 Tax=Streptomyces sp. NPDC052236 TaxID=3365686 RepID=UPI0037CF1D46